MSNGFKQRADVWRLGDTVERVIMEFALVFSCAEAVREMLDDRLGKRQLNTI